MSEKLLVNSCGIIQNHNCDAGIPPVSGFASWSSDAAIRAYWQRITSNISVRIISCTLAMGCSESDWVVGWKCLEHGFYFSIYWEESSQLTNSTTNRQIFLSHANWWNRWTFGRDSLLGSLCFLDKTYWNELGALMVGETGSDRHLVILMGEVGKHVTHIYIYFDVSKTRHVSLNNSCCTYSVVVRVN
jgi:hypothetical protein